MPALSHREPIGFVIELRAAALCCKTMATVFRWINRYGGRHGLQASH